MAVVLANAYAGTLFSFLSVSKLEQPINSLDDLAKSKDVTLIIQNHLQLTDELLVDEDINNRKKYYVSSYEILKFTQDAKNGTEKVIGDTLRANPDNLVPNVKEAKKKLMNGTYAFTFVIFDYYCRVKC